ncbi:DUF6612 family protein [Bacillus sp. FJAT-45037]|uniref:DUF6612 family protein n=1 Tax=Bacillus sp. FJAT-45037 TaxID=2011007 RepID=UPI000C2396EA|nr:DUF6612 family protein [Bacillus sp. FJAT-45037]
MKKLKWIGAGLVALMIMTGCNETSTTETEEPTETETETEVDAPEPDVEEEEVVAPAEDTLTVEDVLAKSIEAMNNVKSYRTDMNISQETSLGQDETIATDISMRMDMIEEPLAFHQQTTMTMPDFGEDAYVTEMYFTEEGVFMYDGMEDFWFSYPEEFQEEFIAIQDMQMNPEEQLELLQSYADNLTLTEEGNHYIITIEGSGQSFDQMADQLHMMFGDAFAEGFSELTAFMDISRMDYAIHINKETFFQEEIDMFMEFSMETEGESISMVQNTTGTFSHFNDIDSITVPTEAIETAEEFSLDLGELEEFDEAEFEVVEEETDE